jgi:adenine-specific DNA-methyltransferase
MKLYQALENQLKKENNFVSDNGELKKWVVINKAQNYDAELIAILLDNKELKEKFFLDIKGTLVFNHNLFVQFLEQKNYLNDSYTQFKNKIGLTIDGKYLKQRNEVELVWPFKDCILEGGQSREEDKREEIFFNETLAQDEITQLLEAKVLTNAKTYDKDGEQNFSGFTRDADLNIKRGLPEDTITDNLIIKGNNLLALHSLKKEFAGKIKLIYIDPPYNSHSQANTFAYNNSFNRSTWLVFMKNRLEIAKRLLTEDGVIVVAIDKNEQPRLQILIEEIFTNYNVDCITVVHNARGVIGTNFSYTHEYAIFVTPLGKKTIGNRKIEKDKIDWRQLRDRGGESLRTDAKKCFYPIIVEDGKVVGFGDVCEDDKHPEQNEIHGSQIYIYPIDNNGVERKWRYARQTVDKIINVLRVKESNGKFSIEIGKDYGTYKTVWTDRKYDASLNGTQLVKGLVSDSKFTFPKSIYNVIDCVNAVVENDKNAIVLDFFGGSGTTAHAVLHINKEDNGKRQFIICEQMDYIETITARRVQKAIENEYSSTSFTYLELKKYNQSFIDQIEKTENSKTLLEVWEQMKAKSFLDYNVDIQKQDEHIGEFKKLELTQQKRHLIGLLDKNQLYVNLSSINDKDLDCSTAEKNVTKDFYQLKKD